MSQLDSNQQLNLYLDLSAPFVRLRPRMFLDGNRWCALYGENIMDGVCGFGDSPELAESAFNRAWQMRGTP